MDKKLAGSKGMEGSMSGCLYSALNENIGHGVGLHAVWSVVYPGTGF